VVAAACSGSKDATTTAGASATTVPSGQAAFAAYRACLAKNGVKLPSRGSGGSSSGQSGQSSGTAPPGGFGGGGFGGGGGGFASNPAFQKAAKACEKLRPTGGFGGGNGNSAGRQAFQAFASCMSDHGITLPSRGGFGSSSTTSSTAPPATVDTSTPQYQAAYNTCKALLPSGGQGGTTTTTKATA
jgi:hypothetical protein